MLGFQPLSTRAISDIGSRPEITPPIFADTVRRASLPIASMQCAALSLPILVNALVPSGLTAYVDRVERRAVLAAHQQAFVTDPTTPAAFVQTVGMVEAPSRIDRRSPFASLQQAFATDPTTPAQAFVANTGLVSFPDRIDRRSFVAAQQLAATENAPTPERTSPIASAVFPDRIPRRVPQEPLEFPTPLDRTSPIASASYPDRLWRTGLPVTEQLAATELAPAPERSSPLASIVFPDILRRARVSYPGAVADGLRPERTATLAGADSPAIVPRRVQRPESAPTVVPQTSAPFLYQQLVGPESVPRRALRVLADSAAGVTQPLPNTPPLVAEAPAVLPTRNRLAWANVGEAPTEFAPLPNAVYPSSVPAPSPARATGDTGAPFQPAASVPFVESLPGSNPARLPLRVPLSALADATFAPLIAWIPSPLATSQALASIDASMADGTPYASIALQSTEASAAIVDPVVTTATTASTDSSTALDTIDRSEGLVFISPSRIPT